MSVSTMVDYILGLLTFAMATTDVSKFNAIHSYSISWLGSHTQRSQVKQWCRGELVFDEARWLG